MAQSADRVSAPHPLPSETTGSSPFFCDSWVVGFWRSRPWLAGHRIGKKSLDAFSSRFWIGWVTRCGDKCVHSTCRADRSWRSQEHSADGQTAWLGECDQLHHFIAAGVWDAAPVETELL